MKQYFVVCDIFKFLTSVVMRLNPIPVYRRLLHERPFITNVLTTCTFMTAGDLISQTLVKSKGDYDLKQTGRFAIAGLLFVGPVVRGCLVGIDKVFGPTSSLLILSRKLMVDQICIAPTFLACNITVLTLLKTQSFEQILNFYFIPLTYRVLFGSVAALVWNTLFSYRLYNKKKILHHYDLMADEANRKFKNP